MTKLNIAIAGAAGRMGQNTLVEVMADDDTVCSGMLVRPSSPTVGDPVTLPGSGAGTGLRFSADHEAVFKESDVVIDFSTVEAVLQHTSLAAKTGTALVIGVTGFSEDQLGVIRAAAEKAPILLSYNMSFGIAGLVKALGGLSHDLGEAFHVEITDIHHKNKKDAPSGTALMLGDALGRNKDAIKYVSVREGTVIGEHHILFSGPAEQIEVIHRAKDRTLFAKGALIAAQWLAGQRAGFYTLNDVLKT